MSDFFGIGAAVKGAVEIYFQAARATGRTRSLIENLNDGDRVIFSTRKMANHIAPYIKAKGVNVEVVVIRIDDISKIYELSTCKGKTVFDHVWVEEFHINSIERANQEIDNWQTRLTGYGHPHITTKTKAMELTKWRT